MTCNHDIGT